MAPNSIILRYHFGNFVHERANVGFPARCRDRQTDRQTTDCCTTLTATDAASVIQRILEHVFRNPNRPIQVITHSCLLENIIILLLAPVS